MAKSGRKLKPTEKPRMPSGRPSMHDRGQTKENAEKRVARLRKFIAGQPHRAGDASVEGGTLIGRLINCGKVRDATGKWTAGDFRQAVEKYTHQRADERWIEEAKRPFAVASGGTRMDPTTEQARDIQAEAALRRRCLREVGEVAERATMWAIEDASPDQNIGVVSFAYCYGASVGLAALCEMWFAKQKRA